MLCHFPGPWLSVSSSIPLFDASILDGLSIPKLHHPILPSLSEIPISNTNLNT
jgi:hypothetical protein